MSPSTTTLSGEASDMVTGMRAQSSSSLVGTDDQRSQGSMRMLWIRSKELQDQLRLGEEIFIDLI